jgi:hypothetical protein
MVLFQVNVPSVALAPFERDAPRAVYMKTVTLRLASERVKIEARDVEVSQTCSLLECVKSSESLFLEVRRHSSAPAFTKQLVKPLVAKIPYHRGTVTYLFTPINRSAIASLL